MCFCNIKFLSQLSSIVQIKLNRKCSNLRKACVMNPSLPLPRQFRIRVHIAVLTMACMAIVAALLIGLGWRATTQRMVQDSGLRAERDTTMLSQQIRLQLNPAQAALRHLGSGRLPLAADEETRLQAIGTLIEELRTNPLEAAVYVAYPNGDFVLVRPLKLAVVRRSVDAPDGAEFLVQTITQQPDGRRVGRFRFLDQGGNLLEIQDRPNYQYDPRTRPWYEIARQHPEKAQLSPPYRFSTTQRTGVTLSKQATAADAVVGIDVAFDDLEQLLVALRATPGTRLALLHGTGQVTAATADLHNVGRDAQPSLGEIDEPQLQHLLRAPKEIGTPQVMEVENRRWIGLHTQLDVGLGDPFELLQMIPFDELSADARNRARYYIGMASALALLMLPLGWAAGKAIGRSLTRLRKRSLRIARFDFTGAPLPPSRVSEVSELSQAVQHMGDTIEAFLSLTESLATEPKVERMLQLVLDQLTQATQSEAAAVYLWDAPSRCMQRTAKAGNLAIPLAERFAYPPMPGPDAEAPASSSILRRDFELRGRQGGLQGLLVLEFNADVAHADAAFQRFAHRLSGMLAVAIETRQLLESQRRLFDAIIQLMADAIDAKSPYTGGHCERVPQMAIEFADSLHASSEGPYANFSLNESERYAFRLAAWLHDCGKVTSPEHIVDKATKLEVIRNRIHEVRLRFEVLWRDAELAAARGELNGEQLRARQQQLRDDFAFVASCNLGGEFLTDESIAKLHAIGAQGWLRHFDDRLGLSAAECRQLDTLRSENPPLPAKERLLADLPEHRVPWGDDRPAVEAGDPRNKYGFDMKLPSHQQNLGELHNLSIRRGTLTDEDRFKINDHMVQTYIMLKGLPWPAGLEQVPELAATHHERLDGKGYPRRLPGERLGVLDRVMAICDVFEALTAADRPYKPAKTLSETLRIMAFMCKEQHLDAELFRYFLRSRLWKEFATRFMNSEQQDPIDLDVLEALLPPQPISTSGA